MSVLIHLKCAIEVCALFYRAFAVIGHASAPENGLAFIIYGLQFQPGIVGIHSAARKEVSNGAGARYHVDAHCVSAPYHALHPVQGRGYGHDFVVGDGCCFGFCFFSHGKCSGELSL